MTAPRLVIDALAARFGGTAYAAIQIAQRLARDDGFAEVVVVTRRGSLVADGLTAGGRLRLVTLRPASRGELARRLAWETIALPREVTRRGPAVVLTWSGMLPIRVPVPVVAYLANPVMFQVDSPANRLRRLAVQRTAASARLIAPSASMARLAGDALGAPVDVVPLGVDHARFSPAADLGDEVLCVADFYGHKRHDVVLDAWAALPRPRPTLRLIGDPRVDPAAYRATRARIDGLREGGPICVDSHVSLTELVAAYRRARVFVVASEHESFCMPLLEALACGIPAVSRDLPVLRETGGAGATYVRGDDAGSWASALEALLDDDEAHRRARSRAIEQAAGFSWNRAATALRDLLLDGAGG